MTDPPTTNNLPPPAWPGTQSTHPAAVSSVAPPIWPGAQSHVTPLGGLYRAAVWTIGLSVLANVLYAVMSWREYRVWADYYAFAPGVTEDDLWAAGDVTAMVGLINLALLIGAAPVFIVWLWNARNNAETISTAWHRRSRGWIIGSWFVPIVCLWFPYQVVRDVWSATAQRAFVDDRQRRRGRVLLAWWWIAFIVSIFAVQVSFRVVIRNDMLTDSDLAVIAAFDIVDAVAWAVAGATLLVVMRQVTRWQRDVALSQGR